MEEGQKTSELLCGSQVPIYLLKTRSGPHDAYGLYFQQLQASAYNPVFIPVLDHVVKNESLRLLQYLAEQQAFAEGRIKKYSGLVFLSQRAVGAFALVISKLDRARIGTLFNKDLPIYAIGPATARSIRNLGLPCQVVCQQTGTSQTLADHILQWHRTISATVTHLHGRRLPLLLLGSEQKGKAQQAQQAQQAPQTISEALQSDDIPIGDRIPVDEVAVYTTIERSGFEGDLAAIIQEAKAAKVTDQWIVTFSPHGCKAMLSALGWLDKKSEKFNPTYRALDRQSIRIASIGPTTRDFLIQKLGFEPDVCAAQPTPEGVGQGILSTLNGLTKAEG